MELAEYPHHIIDRGISKAHFLDRAYFKGVFFRHYPILSS